jgi:hypothetical protein
MEGFPRFLENLPAVGLFVRFRAFRMRKTAAGWIPFVLLCGLLLKTTLYGKARGGEVTGESAWRPARRGRYREAGAFGYSHL